MMMMMMRLEEDMDDIHRQKALEEHPMAVCMYVYVEHTHSLHENILATHTQWETNPSHTLPIYLPT